MSIAGFGAALSTYLTLLAFFEGLAIFPYA